MGTKSSLTRFCIALLGLSVMLALVSQPSSVSAAYPGENGLIAWQHSGTVYVGEPGVDARSLGFGYDPVWSPDGLELAFKLGGSISIVDRFGQATRIVTEGKEPTWSPDGKRLAFASSRDGDTDIYVVNVDGTNVVQLTNSDAYDSKLAWSPDGSKIAFASDYSGYVEIYVMNADGTAQTRLTYHADVDTNPAWSPDGTKIAYSSITYRSSLLERNSDIMVIGARGGSPTRITTDQLDAEYPIRDSYPAWSPDGTKIVFQSDRYDIFECHKYIDFPWKCRAEKIWIMDADGSNWELVTPERIGHTPDWQPKAPPPEPGPFDDVPSYHLFAADIEWLADRGITKGCNPPANDRFCPDAQVTRGQMAAFLVRALGLTNRLDNPLTDDDESVFQRDIERLAAAGITRGCNPAEGNTKFCSDAQVTRGQMAAILVRALGYTDSSAGDLFIDDDGSVFELDIDRLGTAGVTKGCNPPVDDRFCPGAGVTRGQMAAFLHRAFS